MPSGAPDFNAIALPSLGILGSNQTFWSVFEDGDIAGGANADFVSYTVPIGQELHILSFLVGTDFPGISKFAPYLGPFRLALGYYNLGGALPLNPAAAFIIPAGFTAFGRIYNLDDIVHHYAVAALGFLLAV